MKVKDLPFNNDLIGVRVWNFKKTKQGTIVKLYYESKGEDRYNSLDIVFDGDSECESPFTFHETLELEVV